MNQNSRTFAIYLKTVLKCLLMLCFVCFSFLLARAGSSYTLVNFMLMAEDNLEFYLPLYASVQ